MENVICIWKGCNLFELIALLYCISVVASAQRACAANNYMAIAAG